VAVIRANGPLNPVLAIGGPLCISYIMPARSSKDHDFVTVARSVVEQAMFEHLNGRPLENRVDGKNLANVKAALASGVIRGPFPARPHIQCVSPGRTQAGPGRSELLARSSGVTWTAAVLRPHDPWEGQAFEKLQDASGGSAQPA
jgi:hypothetical protein